jgi:hypothetical protein
MSSPSDFWGVESGRPQLGGASRERRASVTFVQNMSPAGYDGPNPAESFLPSAGVDHLHRIASDGTLSRLPSPIIRFLPPSPSRANTNASVPSRDHVTSEIPTSDYGEARSSSQALNADARLLDGPTGVSLATADAPENASGAHTHDAACTHSPPGAVPSSLKCSHVPDLPSPEYMASLHSCGRDKAGSRDVGSHGGREGGSDGSHNLQQLDGDGDGVTQQRHVPTSPGDTTGAERHGPAERVLPAWISSGGPLSPRRLARMRAASGRWGGAGKEAREEVPSSTAHALPLVKATLVRKRAGVATHAARRRGARSVADTAFAMRLEQRLLHGTAPAELPPHVQLAGTGDRRPGPPARDACGDPGSDAAGPRAGARQGEGGMDARAAPLCRYQVTGSSAETCSSTHVRIRMINEEEARRAGHGASAYGQESLHGAQWDEGEAAPVSLVTAHVGFLSPRRGARQHAAPGPLERSQWSGGSACTSRAGSEASPGPLAASAGSEASLLQADAQRPLLHLPSVESPRRAPPRNESSLLHSSPHTNRPGASAEPNPVRLSPPAPASPPPGRAWHGLAQSPCVAAACGPRLPGTAALDGTACRAQRAVAGDAAGMWEGSPSSSLLSSAATHPVSVSLERAGPQGGGAGGGGTRASSAESTPRSRRQAESAAQSPRRDARRDSEWADKRRGAAGLLCYDDVLGYSFLTPQEMARAAALGRVERVGGAGGVTGASRIVGGVVLPSKAPQAAVDGAGRGVGVSRLYRAEVSVPSGYAEEFLRYLAVRSRAARAP